MLPIIHIWEWSKIRIRVGFEKNLKTNCQQWRAGKGNVMPSSNSNIGVLMQMHIN